MADDPKDLLHETRVALNVVSEHLATLELAVIEQGVAIEKLLALQKDLHTEAGRKPRSKEAVEKQLRKIDAQCRHRVVVRIRSGTVCSDETPIGESLPPVDRN